MLLLLSALLHLVVSRMLPDHGPFLYNVSHHTDNFLKALAQNRIRQQNKGEFQVFNNDKFPGSLIFVVIS